MVIEIKRNHTARDATGLSRGGLKRAVAVVAANVKLHGARPWHLQVAPFIAFFAWAFRKIEAQEIAALLATDD
jgi:hypothetical protein